MIYKIDPYKMTSKSAKVLSRALGAQRLLKVNSKFNQKLRHKVINWGNSVTHQGVFKYACNQPEAVSIASCKLRTFCQLSLSEVPTPEWTTRKDVVKQWLSEGYKVYCRHKLRANSGKGITIIQAQQVSEDTTCYPEIPDAPLYTKGLTEWSECRIHMDKNGLLIDWQQKRKRSGSEVSIEEVRNHGNDYVFCRHVDPPPPIAFDVARQAVNALGLDFGAVDVAVISPSEAVVFEVNSAPGLTGTTIDNYVSYFKNGEDHVRV